MAASQIVFQGRRFNVERNELHRPDGGMRVVDVIRHPGAAVILPILDDGRIVLIKNRRHSIGKELLELPAGTLDPDESPEQCALRELKEETGYTAQLIEPLIGFYSSPGICDERMHTFVAMKLEPGKTSLDDGEEIQLWPMTYDAALAAIADGRIVDGKTIVSLLYYDWRKRHEA